MQGINFNHWANLQGREGLPEPHSNVVNSRSVGSISADSLWFLQLLCAWSLLFYLCSFLRLCPSFSSRIKHNAFSRGWLLPSPSLAGSQTWVSSTTLGRRLTFGESLYYPIQWVESKDGPPESYSGVWDILVHLSPPVQAYLWTTSFIGRIFHGLHTG